MSTELQRKRVEKLVWVLIYGGLFAVVLGIATGSNERTLGIGLAVAGGIATAIGALLVVVRSRMK